MASLTKSKKSRFWIACYTDRSGRQLKRSTKTTDKREAMRIAVEIEDLEQRSRRSAMTTAQLQKIFNDVSEKVTGSGISGPTTREYFEEWLKAAKKTKAASTYDRYEKSVRVFLSSLEGVADQPLTSVRPEHVENFLNDRIAEGLAPRTVILDVKVINTAFRRAEAYGVIIRNPVTAVALPKEQGSERDVFTPEEVQKLYASAPTVEWQTLILLGFFLGARLSDCVNMRWCNVHPEKGTIEYEQRKTGKAVQVPMHYNLIEHLTHLSKFGTDGFLCPKLATKGPGGQHGLSESFKRIVKKAGLELGVVEGKGVRRFTRRTFHSLRHSFTSALANAGVSEELRMKLTGHSTRDIHSRYTHLEMRALKSAVTSIPLFAVSKE